MPTNGMTIDSLNTVSSLTAQDEVPVWDKEASGEPTRKITAQNMANSVKSLASLPNTTEMNNAIAQSTATSVRGFARRERVALTAVNNSADVSFQEDGVLSVVSTGTSTSVGYIYVTENGTTLSSIACPQGSGGLTYTLIIPVIKGVPYKVIWGGGFTTPVAYYYPFKYTT